MSQELERVYTIPLGKGLLSKSQHRAVRAINMIREFARKHMKTQEIKIDEEVAHLIWSKGVRSPPRKIRVKLTKTDDGFILVSNYDGDTESDEKDTKKSPEIKQNCKDSAGILWRCGLDAKQALIDLVYSQIVTCIGSKRDRYKRLIAKCYVNDLNIESFMVENGWAIAYRKYSLDYVGEEKIAKSKKVGIWRGEFLAPSIWRNNYREK